MQLADFIEESRKQKKGIALALMMENALYGHLGPLLTILRF